ncbi:MAG: single-strand selective monofunctional uracil DNA glycosylase [Kiritimatiellia bacterium]|jgi:single-strand selective monofunctional uracil DNA glycosylase
MAALADITDHLNDDLSGLTFSPPVTHVYNPLIYARPAWNQYCDMYGRGQRDVLLIGMNPGPWGMSQVGVPFGEIAHVRDWLGIDAPIGKPVNEHPKRQVSGFSCSRSEVSGRRLWSWAAATFGTPDVFFERFFVANYCPLAFMEASGRNRIPEKLPKEERQALFAACDKALRRTVDHFQPKYVVGVGKFAEKKAKQVLGDRDLIIGSVLHPSPASPKANRGWAEAAVLDFQALGIPLP